MTWLLLASALAGPAPCEEALTTPPPDLSVAWISPLGRQVRSGTRVEVVRTADLRAWLGAHPEADLARTLQLLGLRKKAEPIDDLWKVTIFDVRSADLCRPIADVDEGYLVRGLPACGRSRPGSRCGYTSDRASGRRGLDVYRVSWSDAAARGFCVLPAERFLEEGRIQ